MQKVSRKTIYGALPIVAAAYGEKFGVKVVVAGDDAQTDGKTITLPRLPEDYPHMDALWGFLAHEGAHVRHTSFDDWSEMASARSEVRTGLANILEDCRIEKEMVREYPGTKQTLEAATQFMVDAQRMHMYQGGEHPAHVLLGYSLYWCRSQVLEQSVLQPHFESVVKALETTFPAGMVVRLNALLRKVVGTQSTADVVALTDEILAMLRDEAQKQQPPSPSQQNQQQDASNGADDDDQGDDQDQNGDSDDQQNNAGNQGDQDDQDGNDSSAGADNGQKEEDQGGQTGGQGDQQNDADDKPGNQDDASGSSAGADQSNEQDDQNDDQGDQQSPQGGAGDQGDQDDDSSDDGNNSQPEGGVGGQDGAEPSDGGDSTQGAVSAIQRVFQADAADVPEDTFAALREEFQKASVGTGEATYQTVRQAIPASGYSGGNNLASQVKSTTAKIRSQLYGLVQASQRSGSRTKRTGKRLDTRNLHRVLVGDTRVYRTPAERQRPNTAVHIVVDMSSSMGHYVIPNTNKKFEEVAREAAMALAMALEPIPGVNPAVTFFCDDSSQPVYSVVKHGERVGKNADRFMFTSRGLTPMAEAVWYGAYELSKTREDRKMMIVVTDGDPDCVDSARSVIGLCEQSGFDMVGIGICTTAVTSLFKKHIVINDAADLQRTLFRLMERSLTASDAA